MSDNNNLTKILSTNSYNLETIRKCLKCDHSSINKTNKYGETPLSTLLKNSNCSTEIVRLLLQFGADVNVRYSYQKFTPLLTALHYFREEATIEALLEMGAKVDVYDYAGRTPLRYIFSNCDWKQSVNAEWKEKVLHLLLKAGLDLNKVTTHERYAGHSPLCLALWEGADVHDIELLLRKGGSLSACQKHDTPLLCATHNYSGALLKADLVRLLLDKQARDNKDSNMDFKPLRAALVNCRYETAAIEVLLHSLDKSALNTRIRCTNALHLVVGNPNCKTSIVKLFLQRGAKVDLLNKNGETVIQSALRNEMKEAILLNCYQKVVLL